MLSNTTPTLINAINDVIDNKIRNMHVAMPAVVDSYDMSQQRVSVQPVLRDVYYDEEGNRKTEKLPIIPDIPVCFPGAGDFSITFPIKKGDTVLLVITDRCLDRWIQHKNNSNDVDPVNDRSHDITDAVAIPGIRTFNNATSEVVSSALVINGDMRLGAADATDPVALKSDLDELRTWILAHTHVGVTTGTGISGIPSTTPSYPSLTFSTKVKAK